MDLKDLIRREISSLPVYEPGKPVELVARENGLNPQNIVKLASNENPLGAPPAAIQAICEAATEVARYPDNSGYELVNALAAKHQVDPKRIVLGSGSNEIFYLLCDLVANAGTEVIVGEFAFVTYQIAAKLAGAKVISVPMPGLVHDLDAMRAAITDKTRLVFLPNPNNPTATALPASEILHFARSLPPHVILCYDAAYAEYEDQVPDIVSLQNQGVKVIETRTFSKIYGLSGLRIGYAVADEQLASLLNAVRPPFNTSLIAQRAALAALRDPRWVQSCRLANAAGRAQLTDALTRSGLSAFGTHGNFILLGVADGRQASAAFQRHGVIVRPLNGYGLPQWIRITIGSDSENARLLEAVASIPNNCFADPFPPLRST